MYPEPEPVTYPGHQEYVQPRTRQLRTKFPESETRQERTKYPESAGGQEGLITYPHLSQAKRTSTYPEMRSYPKHRNG